MVNFSQLYDKHVDSLFSFGSKFTSDRELIKDCIQDVFVKLFNKKETLDKVCNIESYLYVSLLWNNTSTTCRHASSRLYTYII